MAKVSKPKLTRSQRARNLFNAGVRPVRTADGWLVMSSSGKEFYDVTETGGCLYCNCPDSVFRSHQGELCYHAQLVELCLGFDRMVCADDVDAPIVVF
jgi:hypothetical protein